MSITFNYILTKCEEYPEYGYVINEHILKWCREMDTLRREVLPNAKPMTPEERSSINEFFWSHFNKPKGAAMNDTARCYICGSTDEVRMSFKWLTDLGEPCCFDCFVAWYDCGKTNLEEIRAKSLEMQAVKNQSAQEP